MLNIGEMRDGIVVNAFVGDAAFMQAQRRAGRQLIELPAGVGMGWRYADQAWSPPVPQEGAEALSQKSDREAGSRIAVTLTREERLELELAAIPEGESAEARRKAARARVLLADLRSAADVSRGEIEAEIRQVLGRGAPSDAAAPPNGPPVRT